MGMVSAFSSQTKERIGFYEALHLKKTGKVMHAFCTRRGGVSPAPFQSLNLSVNTGDREGHVRKNREVLTRAFGFPPSALLTVNQIHEDRILIVEAPDQEDFSRASCDAIVTNRPGIAIGVLTADCVPILILDPGRCIVAAIHVGWKGTALNLCGKTIRVMVERFGAHPENLLVAVGPSIGPCCYEVDEPVRSGFSQRYSYWREWAEPSGSDHWRFDLPRANRDLLVASGIGNENIARCHLCTDCHEDAFFSYRRDGGITGRQISFIMLK
jgi:hypothetical protein